MKTRIFRALILSLSLFIGNATAVVTLAQIPADQKTTLDGTIFAWSHTDAIEHMYCTQIFEMAEPTAHSWDDNYFCASENLAMQWSSEGPIEDMDCTQILEGVNSSNWKDNYLCLPLSSRFLFLFNAADARGAYSVRWLELADLDAWDNNYLTILLSANEEPVREQTALLHKGWILGFIRSFSF